VFKELLLCFINLPILTYILFCPVLVEGVGGEFINLSMQTAKYFLQFSS